MSDKFRFISKLNKYKHEKQINYDNFTEKDKKNLLKNLNIKHEEELNWLIEEAKKVDKSTEQLLSFIEYNSLGLPPFNTWNPDLHREISIILEISPDIYDYIKDEIIKIMNTSPGAAPVASASPGGAGSALALSSTPEINNL